ncbi:MAG: hypothetical protein MUE43_06980 [Serpentinimonas sp.]|nr:hypothetical protein [Serpentinimonas sp.]
MLPSDPAPSRSPTLSRRTASAAVAVAIAGSLSLQAMASTEPAPRDDHDWARDAVRSGDIRPLTDILQVLERDFLGQVVEIELERSTRSVVYEIELLSPKGHLVELAYDARTGQLVRAEGRGLESARRPVRPSSGVHP